MGSFFESHPAIGKLFLCQPLPVFQLDDIFYAGMAYVLIFCWFIWSAAWLESLCTWFPNQKNWRIAKYQIGAGVIAVVITLLVIQMGLTVLSTVPMASIQNRLNASGLILLLSFIPRSVPVCSTTCGWLRLSELKEQKWRKEWDKSDSRKDAHFFVGEIWIKILDILEFDKVKQLFEPYLQTEQGEMELAALTPTDKKKASKRPLWS